MPTIEYVLQGIVFEWDPDKQQLVSEQRNISFEEACSIFLDYHEVTLVDKRFADNEQRFITIGMSGQARLLVVAWTQRQDNVRLITVIKAEKKHEQRYQRGC